MKVRHLLIGVVVLFVVSLMTTQSYAKIDEDNIVGIWLFDEGEGDTAEDSSGNKNDGAVNGAEWVDDMFQSGKALEFDGSSSYVLIQFLEPAPRSITLEAWIYPTASGVVFSEVGQAAINSGWHDSQMEILSSGEIKVGFWVGSEQGISLGTYSFEEWYHVVMTFDDGDNDIKGYVDGELQGEGTLDKLYPPALWYGIGAADSTNLGDGTYFDGIIDNIAVYNIALSEEDVNQNYQEALAVLPIGKLATTWASVKTK